MHVIELKDDDLYIKMFNNRDDEVYVRIGKVAGALARFNNSSDWLQDERKHFPQINAAVQLGQLKPIDPLTSAPLWSEENTNDYGRGIVPINELVNWGHTQGYNFTMKQAAPAPKVKTVPVATHAPATTTNKLRRNSLDPAIDEAIKQAGSNELAAVYLKLKAMALDEVMPFTGELDGDALRYTDDENNPAKLTKDALGKRLKRR